MGKTYFIGTCIAIGLVMLLKEGQCLERVKRYAPIISEVYALDHFIEIVEKIERNVTNIKKVVEHIRSLGYNDEYWQALIGHAESLPNGILNLTEKDVLTKMVAHSYYGSRELGVVRTSSGETIAIGHVINGLSAGINRDYARNLNAWSPRSEMPVDNVFAATLARDLVESALANKNDASKKLFGPGGVWNDDQCPKTYTLNGAITGATNAELLGSVDGLLLGYQIFQWASKVRLGQLLRMYYSTGVCFDKSFVSCKRYAKFDSLINKGDTTRWVKALAEAWYLRDPDQYPNVKQDNLQQISEDVVHKFTPYLKNLPSQQIKCPTNKEGCEMPANLVFLMDESGSVSPSAFLQEKSFVSQTIDAFTISPKQTKVAAIKFGSYASIDVNLHRYGSKTRLKCAINQMGKMGGGTNTAGALDLARTDIFLPIMQSKQSNEKQDDSVNILILLTDGQSNRPTTTAIYDAIDRIKGQVKGLTMIAIGVDNYNLRELEAAATDPHKHVFKAANFQDLLSFVKRLQNRTCTTPVDMDLDFQKKGNISEVTAFILPDKVRYFVLTSKHFFGVDIKIKITAVHGQIRVYASRIRETPGPNNYQYKLDPIPAGKSMELNIANPCKGYTNDTSCPPLYLAFYHAEKVQCTCTEPECFLPGQIKFTIEKGGSKSNKIQASFFFILITLALAFSNV